MKEDIIKFLSQCPNRRIHKKKFWDSLQNFSGKTRKKTDFGVPSMNNVFDVFDDIILYRDDFIQLKDQANKADTQWGSGAQVNTGIAHNTANAR